MSYIVQEQSDSSGQPLELYRFSMGSSLYLYTSADHVVSVSGEEYQPVYIQRGGFTKGGDVRKSSMDIEIAADSPLALAFRSGWLPSVMLVTVFRMHYQDSDVSVLWKGRVTGCSWSGSMAKLATESVFTLFKRAGLRRVYQINCPHQLYGAACGVDVDAHSLTAHITAVVGPVLTVAGAGARPDGWFTGGVCVVGDDKRLIIGHDGDNVILISGIDGVVAGASATLWPGCDRTTATCIGKFNNIVNFGGLPYLPTKNPFSGDALV